MWSDEETNFQWHINLNAKLFVKAKMMQKECGLAFTYIGAYDIEFRNEGMFDPVDSNLGQKNQQDIGKKSQKIHYKGGNRRSRKSNKKKIKRFVRWDYSCICQIETFNQTTMRYDIEISS